MENKEVCAECKGAHRILCKDCGGGGMAMGCFCQVCDEEGMQACDCTIKISRRQARKMAKEANKKPWSQKKD